jgi:hypothetical protein
LDAFLAWLFCPIDVSGEQGGVDADAMGNLQYQHPIDFATSRPIILNELHDVHFRWHDASEEQAEKYWQVRMTTEEKE